MGSKLESVVICTSNEQICTSNEHFSQASVVRKQWICPMFCRWHVADLHTALTCVSIDILESTMAARFFTELDGAMVVSLMVTPVILTLTT